MGKLKFFNGQVPTKDAKKMKVPAKYVFDSFASALKFRAVALPTGKLASTFC